MKKTMMTALFAGAAMMGAANAAVLIGDGVNNGGFVSTTTGRTEGTALTDWTITGAKVWLNTGGSTLTTAPFGADVAANSRSVQLEDDGGVTLTSAAVALVAGESLTFAIDWLTAGSGAEHTLTMDLWDGSNSIALGVLSTTGGPTSYTQFDSAASVGVSGNYQLRMTLTGGAGQGRDIHVDRVYLESTAQAVPEPSSTALLGLGGLALILRRRK
ncbi:PEP-CTERM sorting domain-containing protein [Sulfuriroseicoccus oceanibius]|uniref:PEP-CTERM sorting domain-containing protein n=1 Tax=Sulfuriroseicoccus oceanibius TaxID=2707525 RepID=A0A6B3LCG9_9BACT|nr:PEP-CTERM sorting domain-containing protein [Sulfuriroseicoccus oceanibius]QQL45586.1 PEP-CTERM sorting domain-containing protein [Sulfuriroseicoccus oceanibius]